LFNAKSKSRFDQSSRLTLLKASAIASIKLGVAMQHFANHAMNAFREAIGFLPFARAEISANCTLKLKTTKKTKTTTTKTV
jgi:hypothetical protein